MNFTQITAEEMTLTVDKVVLRVEEDFNRCVEVEEAEVGSLIVVVVE